MRINAKPRKQNAGRPQWKIDRAKQQWLRGRRCAFEHLGGCDGKIEVAHMPDPETKGVGTKASDASTVPACQHHHQLHTNKGWSALGLTKETARALGAGWHAAWLRTSMGQAWEARNA